MTSLIVELPNQQKAALVAKAHPKGLSAEQYARQVLEKDLSPEWLKSSWEISKEEGVDQRSPEEINAEISAARMARGESRLQPGS